MAWEFVSPGYTSVIHAAVLYACVYFIAFYALMRVSKVHLLIAVAGTLAVVWASLFGPYHTESTIRWAWPSHSVLRAPLDAWMALAIIAHLKSNRRIWLAVAGLLGGAAVFLEIDTGVPLVVALAVYCLAIAIIDRPEDSPSVSGDLAVTACTFLAVLAAALTLASRGTIFTNPFNFLSGWLKGITGYAGSGAGNMYFLSRMDAPPLILFVAFVAICFVPVAIALTRFIHGRATRSNIFAAACGIYGLERLTVYITRTLDNNLLHTALPAIGILTVVVSCFYSKVFQSGDQPKPSSPENFERNTLQIALPGIILLMSVLLPWTSDTFHRYPSLLRSTLKGSPDPGLPLLAESLQANGIPVEKTEKLQDIEQTVLKMRNLLDNDATIVVLDEHATLLNIAADNPPWRVDISVYFNTFFVQDRENILSELSSYSPDYILITTESPREWYEDTWAFYRDGLAENYAQSERVGQFDLLERRPQ